MSLHQHQPHDDEPLWGPPIHPTPIAKLQALCIDLYGLLELERSGVRDGDGMWHGCDPIHATVDEMIALRDEVARRG